jgi:hypothetical protein
MKFIKKYWLVIGITLFVLASIKLELTMILFSSMVIYGCVEMGIFVKKMDKSGIECVGKIVGYEFKTPVIEFTTASGILIKEQPFVYGSTNLNGITLSKNNIDQLVSVLYDINEPKKFVLSGDKGMNYFLMGFIILIALFFFIMGIGSLFGLLKLF